MKHFVILIFLFSWISCFSFDKLPETIIEIDKSIISLIDSVEIISNNSYPEESEPQKVIVKDETRYDFGFESNRFIVKLILKDKSIVKSKLFDNYELKDVIYISKDNSSFKFEPVEESHLFKKIMTFLAIIISILITKVPIALLIIQPENKKEFFVRFAGINLIYFLCLALILLVFLDAFILFYILSYFVVFIADILYLTTNYGDSSKLKPILAAIVSNLLFITIGQIMIMILLMI